MNGRIICVSGKIGSGKSFFANMASKELGIDVVGVGDYVRSIAKQDYGDIEIPREILQEIGLIEIGKGMDILLDNLLKFANWAEKDNLIIEGVRYLEFVDEIRKRQDVEDVLSVYVDVDEDKRISQIEKRDGNNITKPAATHVTESNHSELKEFADIIVVNGESNFEKCIDTELKKFLDIDEHNYEEYGL